MSINAVTLAYGKSEDPDAQATITDYLDYTEYLPADLNRALALIGKLDEDYSERANKVHELSRSYGELPNLTTPDVDPQVLRTELSYNLKLAIKAREASCGEAERMYKMINRYHNRLSGIQTKLLALPKPPSRDPTPVAKSPPTNRKTPTRIHLRLDGVRNTATAGRHLDKERKNSHRNRRITIPGEVLPPPNPDSPQDFTDSDWESMPPSPLPMPTSRVGGSRSRSHKPGRIRPSKHLKVPKDRLPRVPRQPGMGTNVHSQVAGISTSNALSLLPKPPADAEQGSEHAPWMRLTEYEMALLRKRMKKNAIWTPSETMIRRELAAAGRGPDAYRKRKAHCEEEQEDFVDTDNVAASSPNRPLVPGEIRAESLGVASENLSNRGMKLNEAKKHKRELQLERTRQETREAQRNLDSLGPVFKDLFKKPGSLESPRTPLFPTANGYLQNDNSVEKTKNSKRKTPRKKVNEAKSVKAQEARSPSKSIETLTAATEHTEQHDSVTAVMPVTLPLGPPPKRRKTETPSAPVSETTTRFVPLASPGPSTPHREGQRKKPSTPLTTASILKKSKTSSTSSRSENASSRPRGVSLTLRGPASPHKAGEATISNPRRGGRFETTNGSPSRGTRERPFRASITTGTPANPTVPATPGSTLNSTAASRRSKRPINNKIAQEDDDLGPMPPSARSRSSRNDRVTLGATIRNSARRKPGPKSKHMEQPDQMQLDLPDPDEPRYCICNDVSWGEMVACENQHVSPVFSLYMRLTSDIAFSAKGNGFTMFVLGY